MIAERNRIRFPAYDFREQRGALGRNAIHDYPAMLHTNLVGSLIEEFACPGDDICDPFCGSGTTVVQALLHGYRVYGTDINPLALLIAKVRSSNVDITRSLEHLDHLKERFAELSPDVPQIKNISYWYKEKVIRDLGRIRKLIMGISTSEIRELFLVAFSSTARASSNSKNSEFKRCRIPGDRLVAHNPNVLSIFEGTVRRYLKILKDNPLQSKMYHLRLADTRKPLPMSSKIGLVITSPPYGDSQTTVAYGQFSSFSMDWIRGLNPFGDSDLSLDRAGLGGRSGRKLFIEESEALTRTLIEIYRQDRHRACEVSSFYHDLYSSCVNIVVKLDNNARVCFVVGNRIVKGVQIPMDCIIVDFFESLGLSHIETRIREISNKRMPLMNSPSNIIGEKSATMREEYIVIMERKDV